MSKIEELTKEYHEVYYKLHGHKDHWFSKHFDEWDLNHLIRIMKRDIQEREWFGNPQDVYAVNQYEGLRVW